MLHDAATSAQTDEDFQQQAVQHQVRASTKLQQLPDIIEQTEDPDYQICMDQAFHEVSKLFDMSDLLAKFDKLDRAREPIDIVPIAPVTVADSRSSAVLEPFSVTYFEQPALLKQLVPPVIDWPGAQAVPVVIGDRKSVV